MNRLPLVCALLCAPAAVLAEISPQAVGSVVRSDKWNIKRQPHKVEELSGNVVYRKGDRNLRADWALYDHKDRILRAKGDIRIEQKTFEGRRILLYGEHALYDENSHEGTLHGRSDVDEVLFDRVDAQGQPVGQAKSRAVKWNAEREVLTLEGRRPYLKAEEQGWSGAVQADRITAYRGTETGRRIVAEGAASGWFYFPHDTDRSASYPR